AGPTFWHLAGFPIPFETGKLAQKRNWFARKRSRGNFFVFGRPKQVTSAMLQSEKSVWPHRKDRPSGVMFCLTEKKLSRRIVKGMNRGAKIKLETVASRSSWGKCRMIVAEAPCDGRHVLLSDRFALTSVTGNVRYGSLAHHVRIVAEESGPALVRRADRSLRPV